MVTDTKIVHCAFEFKGGGRASGSRPKPFEDHLIRIARRTVALLAEQYLRLSPFKGFIEALKLAGRDVKLPPIRPMPPIIKEARGRPEP